jgi:hypothetical protein
MKCKEVQIDKQRLQASLGVPKYYIDTPGLEDGQIYSWFPTKGDSMTDNTPKSIPSGSLVLGRCLELKSVLDIPLHRPIVLIVDDYGKQVCVLKSGCKIKYWTDEMGVHCGALCLRSYNPAPSCDDIWISFSSIKFVFVVERVRLPNGDEFVPKQEEVIRKGNGQ